MKRVKEKIKYTITRFPLFLFDKLKSFDLFCQNKKIYVIFAVFIIVLVNQLLIDSFNIEKSYANVETPQERYLMLGTRTSVQLSFVASESQLSTIRIFKNTQYSYLSVSDRANVSIIDADGEILYETEVYLYHAYRNYITVNCENLRLRKGDIYTVRLSASQMDSASVCYLQAHDINDFAAMNVQAAQADIAMGFRTVPDAIFDYSVKHYGYMIVNQIFIIFAVIVFFIPFFQKHIIFKELTRALLIPVFIYITQETLNVSKSSPMQVLFPRTIQHYFTLIGCLLIFLFMYQLLYSISGRGTLSMMIIAVAGISFGYINHFKILLRGDPAMPWDIFAAGIAARIATNYSLKISIQFICSILLCILIIILLRVSHTPARKNLKKRLIPFILSVSALAGLFLGVILNRGLLEKIDINYDLFPPLQSYNENGTIMALAMNLNHLVYQNEGMQEHEDAESLITEYQEKSDKPGEEKTQKYPNVICVMSEAFCDFRELRAVETNIDVLPFYDSIIQDSMNGNLAVSIFGGGTCNTEFEFLTGYSVRNLLPGSSVYSLNVERDLTISLPHIFRENGYQTLAIHPFDGLWWDREATYPLLGFDRFLTRDDFEDPHYIREYISDYSAFMRIIEEYENKDPDKPLFTFLVTMQNHADFNNTWEDKKYDVKIENFPDQDFSGTENYLSLLRESDDALMELVTYFKEQEEPVIIVFFGDHKPFLEPDFYNAMLDADLGDLSVRESEALYTTPFFVWANYSLPLKDQDIISPNFLGQRILELAGVPSPAERFVLQAMQQEIEAVSAVAVYKTRDEFYTAADVLPDPVDKLLNDYAVIQQRALFPQP